jgi:hypothetical protein
MCSSSSCRSSTDSARLDTMSGSDCSIRRLYFVYTPLSDSSVLGLACLVIEGCVDALVEGASDGFTSAVDAFHGAFDVVANVTAGVGHDGRMWRLECEKYGLGYLIELLRLRLGLSFYKAESVLKGGSRVSEQ